MTHACNVRSWNLVGALGQAVADRVSVTMAEPSGSAAAALLLVYHGHVRWIDDLRSPLALTHAGVVRLVDRLETGGLMVRVPGVAPDRRSVALVLTDAGTARAHELLSARERGLGELLGDVAPDQLAQLASACESVLATIAANAPDRTRLCRYCDEEACDLARCPVELAAVGPEEAPP